jgi:hypothetical protein
MVRFQRRTDIVVQSQLAIGENSTLVAILPDGMGVMGYENDVGALHALPERLGASAAEPLIADLGHFVDQVDVEVDRETGSKGQPCAHPGRKGIHRHLKVFPEFGERLDVVDRAPYRRSIDAGDEGNVFASG